MRPERSGSIRLFRVSRHAGIWCVLRNGAFLADCKSQDEAIEAAQSAAQKEEALGYQVQVVTSSIATFQSAVRRPLRSIE
jgi:hypothetical protein